MLSHQSVMKYMERASMMKHSPPSFANKIMINLFYEPSTRTSCSFQVAAYKLGCKVINITDKYSSVEKVLFNINYKFNILFDQSISQLL